MLVLSVVALATGKELATLNTVEVALVRAKELAMAEVPLTTVETTWSEEEMTKAEGATALNRESSSQTIQILFHSKFHSQLLEYFTCQKYYSQL
jgi:hypothetical protein